MTDRVVATGALQPSGLSVRYVAIDGSSDVLVAAPASILGDVVIEAGDFDSVGIPASGEVKGMPESIVGFDRVFPDDVMRRVAVVAGGDGVVARLHPRVVFRPHHVAISAGCRIVGEVGVSLCIDECICAQTDDQTKQNRERNAQHYGSLHQTPFVSEKDTSIASDLWRTNLFGSPGRGKFISGMPLRERKPDSPRLGLQHFRDRGLIEFF
jgi:hypothetical protein